MKCRNCKRENPENALYCNWCGAKQIREEIKKEIKVPKPRQLKSGNWFINLRVKGMDDVPVTESTEARCIARAQAIKAGMLEAKQRDRRKVKTLVEEYIQTREGKISPATIDGYYRKSKYNLQSLMGLDVDQLTTERVQAAVDEDAKKYAGKTIKEAVALIQSATGAKFKGLVLPSTNPKKKPPILTEKQISALLRALSASGGEIECAGLLAMWLSLRRSEIKGLKWSDIGEDSIRIQNARIYDKNHKLVEKDTKTDKSARVIPCPTYILDKLNALPKTEDYVLRRSTHYLWQGITNACTAAGVPHTYLHGLRHTNATVMALLKVPNKYAMRRGGWATSKVMESIYQDTMQEGEIEIAAQVDAYFQKLANESPEA